MNSSYLSRTLWEVGREGGRPAEPGGGEGGRGAAGSLGKGPQEGSEAGLESPFPTRRAAFGRLSVSAIELRFGRKRGGGGGRGAVAAVGKDVSDSTKMSLILKNVLNSIFANLSCMFLFSSLMQVDHDWRLPPLDLADSLCEVVAPLKSSPSSPPPWDVVWDEIVREVWHSTRWGKEERRRVEWGGGGRSM